MEIQRVRIHEPLHPKRIPGSLYAIKWVSNTEVFAFGQKRTTKSVACYLRNIFLREEKKEGGKIRETNESRQKGNKRATRRDVRGYTLSIVQCEHTASHYVRVTETNVHIRRLASTNFSSFSSSSPPSSVIPSTVHSIHSYVSMSRSRSR